MTTKELRILTLKNRIDILAARGPHNNRLIAKAKRELRRLQA